MKGKTEMFFVLISSLVLYSPNAIPQPREHVSNRGSTEKGTWCGNVALGNLHTVEVGLMYRHSKGSTIGVLFASTNHVNIFGIQLAGSLFHLENEFALSVSTPVLYYPATKGVFDEGSLFFWPVIEAEWIMGEAQVFVCTGVAGALWLQKIQVPAMTAFNLFGAIQQERRIPAADFPSTVHAGFAFPVIQRLRVRLESSILFSGFRLERQNWLGGPAAMVAAGFLYEIN